MICGSKDTALSVSEYSTLGGTSGMPDFVKGAVYGGMMQNFAKIFGDAITPIPTGKTEEVHLGSIQNWGGVRFSFQKGASTDFPTANIIIGDKVYYTHWTPAKSHVSHLQISSLAAIDMGGFL